MRRLLLAFAVALLAPLASAQRGDLPPLSEPRIVTTVFEDGLWHHRNDQPRDNTGDGQVMLVLDGDVRRWVLYLRMGTPPPGGCYWTKLYTTEDPEPYEGWTGNRQQPPIKGMPGAAPYSHVNIDTHNGFQDPYTLYREIFHGVKPANLIEWHEFRFPNSETRPPNPGGIMFGLQRSTQTAFGAEQSNFSLYRSELWLQVHPDATWEHPAYYAHNNTYWGGVAESAHFVDNINFPWAIGVGFYSGKTREAPDAFGERLRVRIGRIAFWLEGPDAYKPVRLPAAGPDSYVWDPVRDGAGGLYGDTNETAVWGTCNRILQQFVWMDPWTGHYHLICWQSLPSTRQGIVNDTVGLAHYWSVDQGLHWIPDSNNPIFTRQSLGWDDIGVANQMNSPHVCIDPWRRKGYLFFWGNQVGRVNKVGTRLYCMEFDIP